MPTTTTNFGWTVPSDTDLVKDGAAAIRTALGGPDTSFVDLKGGTTGQVLSKASGTDLDFTWAASAGIPATILDAKGDLIAATAADTASRLAVGTNGQVLTADSTEATGLKWAGVSTGMTKIAAATFSAVASLDIDSLFSTTYKSYLMILTCVGSGSGKVNIRMRYGAATLTSADYYGSGWSIERGGTTASFGQNATTSRIAIDDMNGKCDMSIFFNRVGNTSEEAIWHGTGIFGTQQQSAHFTGLANVTQTYTGINLSTSAGTITGSYSVYGLAI